MIIFMQYVNVNVATLKISKRIRLQEKKQPRRSCGCLQKETAKNTGNKTILKNSKNQILRNIEYNTNIQMIQKESPIKSNTSGVTGVSYDKSRNKWRADIQVHNQKIRLGRFKNKEDAIKARKEAEEKYFKPILQEIENNK